MTEPCRIISADLPCSDVGTRRKATGRGGWRPGAGRKLVLQDPVSVTLDLEEPQIERLREIADERGVSVASLIRQAVDAFLARRKKK